MKEYDVEYAYTVGTAKPSRGFHMKIMRATITAPSFMEALERCEELPHFRFDYLRKVEFIKIVEVKDDRR